MNNGTKKKVFSILPKKLKGKYSIGERVPSSGIYECNVCENYTAFKKGESFSKCEDCITEGKSEVNRWYVTNEVIHFMSKNLNIEFERISTFHTRLAVKITESSGTMGFVYFHTIWFVLWVLCNNGNFGPYFVFDPYPYGLLTMIVSLEAIFLSTFIMIGQNIMTQQSELRSELDYQVNLKTEKEVAEMMVLLKELKEDYAIIKTPVLEKSDKKKTKKEKKKTKKELEKEEIEREERLLREAGIYMMVQPQEEERE